MKAIMPKQPRLDKICAGIRAECGRPCDLVTRIPNLLGPKSVVIIFCKTCGKSFKEPKDAQVPLIHR